MQVVKHRRPASTGSDRQDRSTPLDRQHITPLLNGEGAEQHREFVLFVLGQLVIVLLADGVAFFQPTRPVKLSFSLEHTRKLNEQRRRLLVFRVCDQSPEEIERGFPLESFFRVALGHLVFETPLADVVGSA